VTKREQQLADYRAERAQEHERNMACAAEAFRQWKQKMAEMEARATKAWFGALDAEWDKLVPGCLPAFSTDLPTLGDGTLPPDDE